MSLDAVVYDLEIVKGIAGRGERHLEGIEYCNGWNDHSGMGISVIGAYDYVDDRYRVFCKDNWEQFSELVCDREWAITFNGVNFDNRVLVANGVSIHNNEGSAEDYDVLREIWITLGLNPDKFSPRSHGGYGLAAMCEANGIRTKSGHGALAPVQWQRGEIGSVIDYCLNDVKITKDLFELSQKGPIKSPKGAALLDLRKVS